MSPFYAIGDVVVLPSNSEGSSNVLLEAMMAWVPIVATTAGVIPEMVVDGQTGLLTRVGDLAGAGGRHQAIVAAAGAGCAADRRGRRAR